MKSITIDSHCSIGASSFDGITCMQRCLLGHENGLSDQRQALGTGNVPASTRSHREHFADDGIGGKNNGDEEAGERILDIRVGILLGESLQSHFGLTDSLYDRLERGYGRVTTAFTTLARKGSLLR